MEIIPDMVKIGLSSAELMSGDAEAIAGAPAMMMGGGGRGRQMTDEQKAKIDEQRKAIEDWREGDKSTMFQGVAKKFSDAGIDLHILCYNMGRNISDDEIDYAFRMAQAMKVKSHVVQQHRGRGQTRGAVRGQIQDDVGWPWT